MAQPLTADPSSPLRNTEQAAAFLLHSRRTLEQWRVKGSGPRFRRVGGKVAYHVDDLHAFIDENVRTSTSDKGR